MKTALDFVLFLAALILFVLAALPVMASRGWLIAVGLACFVAPFVITAWPGR